MVAKHPDELINNLLAEMAVRKVKVPKLAEDTGIPKDRIYKWLQEGNTPKADDQQKLRNWLEKVPREITPTPKTPYNDQSPDYIIGKLNGLLAGEQARRDDAERFYDKLLEKLGSNLSDLSEGQTVLYSFVRTLLEYHAAIASRGDAKKEAELLGILNSRLKTYENMPEKRGIVEPLRT